MPKLVNVVLRKVGKPWVFDDLSRHLCRVGGCTSSEEPLPDADAWIFIRAAEASSSPDLSRTVVQVHDFFTEGYGPGGDREHVRHCGGLVLTQYDHQETMACAGIALKERSGPSATGWRGPAMGAELGFVASRFYPGRVLCRPIGALEAFHQQRPARDPDQPFTIGWCGRPGAARNGVDIKRIGDLVEVAKRMGPSVRVLLAGSHLASTALAIDAAGIEVEDYSNLRNLAWSWESKGPAFYRTIDALLVTSISPGMPMAMYEALASGVPVVSTPVGSYTPPGVFLASGVPQMVAELAKIQQVVLGQNQCPMPGTMFATLESWCREVVELAEEIAR